jgi:hypothetical protein
MERFSINWLTDLLHQYCNSGETVGRILVILAGNDLIPGVNMLKTTRFL